MSDLVREYIDIVMEILLAALIIAVIVALNFLSRQAYSTFVFNKTAVGELETTAEFYEYTNRTVTGSDVIDVIQKYARVYTFEVQLDTGDTYEFSYNGEGKINPVTGERYGDQIWSMEFLSQLFGTAIYDRFDSTLLKQNDCVIGIKFVREGI